MENKVGDELPTEAEVEEAVKALQKVIDKTERYLVTLNKDQRTAALKPRTGYALVVPQIARLATRFGVTLPGISADDMLADLTLVQRLAPLSAAVEDLAQRIHDTQLQAASECWYAATALYTSLARVAPSAPGLERELAPVVDFFAVGRRKATPPTP